ncbi:hypothetical protein RI129_003174 [Pyrocoelia pectoralis]|uniref:HTH CENPB-type domain-containing protein n=1 Tax=Pyrocoelia pectoralis TaxID=417401 RepID=A0AAN7VHN2_9COLE
MNPRLGRKTVFAPEEKKEMADVVKKMANIFYGCTANQIIKVAFDYAESLNLKHTFNTSTKMTGRIWLEGFLRRNNILYGKLKLPVLIELQPLIKQRSCYFTHI